MCVCEDACLHIRVYVAHERSTASEIRTVVAAAANRQQKGVKTGVGTLR